MDRTSPHLAVLVSGNGSNLQSIIDHIDDGRLDARVSCVISNNPDAFGLERARRRHIPAHCINHREFATRQDFEQALLNMLTHFHPDLIILAGFMRILSADFVEHYRDRILNIHPSLLPRHKGLDTHARVLAAGDARHGATVHVVTPELDSGAIVIQRGFEIGADDTVESLMTKIHGIEHEIYPQAISQYAESGFESGQFSRV